MFAFQRFTLQSFFIYKNISKWQNSPRAFGSIVTERNQSFGNSCKYGFNNQEKEAELGDYYSFEYRIHDARLGRFLSVDPLSKDYPWNSSYAFAENRVIDGIDLEGTEWQPVNSKGQNVADNSKEKTGYVYVGFTKTDKGYVPNGGVPCAEMTIGGKNYKWNSNATSGAANCEIKNVANNSLDFTTTISIDEFGSPTSSSYETRRGSSAERFDAEQKCTTSNNPYLNELTSVKKRLVSSHFMSIKFKSDEYNGGEIYFSAKGLRVSQMVAFDQNNYSTDEISKEWLKSAKWYNNRATGRLEESNIIFDVLSFAGPKLLISSFLRYNLIKTATAKTSTKLLGAAPANLTQKGLDHIIARHWFTSGAKGAGKFAQGTTSASLKEMIQTTTTQGMFRANTAGRAGTIAEYNFGRVIGTTSGAAPASNLRVVIGTNGNVITAFPY